MIRVIQSLLKITEIREKANFVHSYCTFSLAILLAVILSSCTSPSKKFDEFAEQLNLKQEIIAGDPFVHAIYVQDNQKQTQSLHVYLEGDGTPWVRETQIALDPTPRKPIALELMNLDSSSSVYLGRPCYHGLSDSNNCSAKFWTSHRYSREVVDSLEIALKNKMKQKKYSYKELVFIGFSGGGTLAVLLAERFDEAKMVITIGANLDHDTWARYHGYSHLFGSLNPSDISSLSEEIKQIHLVGENDSNVPPWMIIESFKKKKDVELVVKKGFSHQCCWDQIWPDFLQSLSVK